MLEPGIFDFLQRLGDPFVNPTKRIFFGYLITALFIGLLWLVWNGTGAGRGRVIAALRQLADRRVWWSPSARADYLILFCNQVIGQTLFTRLVAPLAVATLLFEGLHSLFAGRPILFPSLSPGSVALLFTVCFFLLDDVARYLLHRLLHRWPLLWAFHKVHHSARTLTPLTVYRTHPVEGLLFALRTIAVQAVSIGVFVFFFADRADLLTVLGANIFTFAFNLLGSNLRHSHVPIRYGRIVEHVLISPAQHQVHHSLDPAHHDRNFGAALAIWDWVGGSLTLSPPGGEGLRFGLQARIAPDEQRLWNHFVHPFIEAGALLWPSRRDQARDAASRASRSTSAQSPAATIAFGATQEPPTQATLGSAR